MTTETISIERPMNPLRSALHWVGVGLARLGDAWITTMDSRYGPHEPSWDPEGNLDSEEVRWMVLLYCACAH